MKWFPAPTYPDGADNPLLVRISLDDPPPSECEPFILLDEVDPTPVMYEYQSADRLLFMMRMRGKDIMIDIE